MLPFEDPGWRSSFKALIPFVGPRLVHKQQRAAIETTRSLFLTFVTAWLLFAWVLWSIEIEPGDPLSETLVTGITLAVGVGSIVAALVFIPQLRCDSRGRWSTATAFG